MASGQYADRSEVFIRLSISCIVLPTIAVILRFWSRKVGLNGAYGWDDWICLLALAFNVTLCSLGITWARRGLGRHVDAVKPAELESGLKLLFGAYYIFDLNIGLVKSSALCFYSRVFGNQKKGFKTAIWVGHVFVFLWYIYVILEDSLNCRPARKSWDPSTPGQCIDLFAGYLVTGVWDCALDLYILLLPLPVLYGLQMKLRRKLLIASAFVLGYCCLVASIGRLVTTIYTGQALSEDVTWNATGVLTWTFLEPGLGIISLCVPSWWHLYLRWRKQGLASLFTTKEPAASSQINFARRNRATHNSASESVWSRWYRRMDSIGTGEADVMQSTNLELRSENERLNRPSTSALRNKSSKGSIEPIYSASEHV